MMEEPHYTATYPMISSRVVWIGWAFSLLVMLVFVASAIAKLLAGQEPDEEMVLLGIPTAMVFQLAIVELVCALVYIYPRTSVLGAILLTGYMGGAICVHMRVGEMFIGQVVLGLLIWLALYLRDWRLRMILPWRLGKG